MTQADPDRIQLHPTGIDLFSICGEAWRRRYEENEREGVSAELVVGSAVDVAITADLMEKIKTGQLLPLPSVVGIAQDEVRRRRLPNDEYLLTRASRFVAYAHRQLCPQINAVSVQHSWSVRLDKMLTRRGGLRGRWKKIDLVGTLDIREHYQDFSGSGIAIRDIKTAGASPPADAANGKHWTQLTCYALGEWVNTGAMPARVQIDTLVDLKRGVTHKPSFGERDDFDFAALFNRIVRFAQARQSGIFHYAPRGHWKCTRQYCSFYDTCPATKNKNTIDLAPAIPKLYKIKHVHYPSPLPAATMLLEKATDRSVACQPQESRVISPKKPSLPSSMLK